MKQLKVPVIAVHILGWLFFQSLPLVFLLSQSPGRNIFTIIGSWQYWLFSLYFVAVFYLYSYLLQPLFYKKGRLWLYFLGLALLVFSVFRLEPFEQLMAHTSNKPGMNNIDM